MDAFIAGAWRTAARGEVYTGGQWRRLTRAEAYIGGQWRQILSFAPPFSVSVPSDVYGARYSFKPSFGTASATATATPQGGTSPYSYQWAVIEGNVTLGNPQYATVTISANLSPESEASGIVGVTCTDAEGNVAVGNVMFYLTNYSNA